MSNANLLREMPPYPSERPKRIRFDLDLISEVKRAESRYRDEITVVIERAKRGLQSD
jgi:hypothetical protein